MAWPGNRFTSYVPNNVPVISAAYLNAQQDWTAALTNATVSLLGLNLDGVGGQARTAVPGAIAWTNTVAGGGNPARTTALVNLLMPLLGIKAWGRYVTNGASGFTEFDGGNILSASYPGGNTMLFVLASALDSTSFTVIPFCQFGDSALFPVAAPSAADRFVLNFSKADHRGAGAPTAIDPSNTISMEIHFLVLGRRTS